MVPHLAASLAVILLIADPAPDVVPKASAPQLATALGLTVGAAKECSVGDRADNAMAKAEQLVSQAAAQDDQDDLEMDDRFHDAMAAGREAVLDGATSCADAEAGLKKLEGQVPD